MEVPGLTAGQRLLLARLADYADAGTHEAWPARDTLSRCLGMNGKTIQRHLAELIDLGYVSESHAAQRGRTRTLRLHPEAWPSWREEG